MSSEGKITKVKWSDEMKDIFNSAAHEEWLQEVKKPEGRIVGTKNKLRTYSLFKTKCVMEPYLVCIDDKAKMRLLAKFRMGVAPLRIEVGRYEANGLNNGSCGIPSDKRICQVCNKGLEDEVHMLTSCRGYRQIRRTMYTGIREVNNMMLEHLDDNIGVFSNLMASNNIKVIELVANFIWRAFKLRGNILKGKGIYT